MAEEFKTMHEHILDVKVNDSTKTGADRTRQSIEKLTSAMIPQPLGAQPIGASPIGEAKLGGARGPRMVPVLIAGINVDAIKQVMGLLVGGPSVVPFIGGTDVSAESRSEKRKVAVFADALKKAFESLKRTGAMTLGFLWGRTIGPATELLMANLEMLLIPFQQFLLDLVTAALPKLAKLLPPLQEGFIQLADWVLPYVEKAVDWLVDSLISAGDWIMEDGIHYFEMFWDLLKRMGGWMYETFGPAARGSYEWFMETFIPWFQTNAIGFLENYVWPVLQDIFDWISTDVYNWLKGTFLPFLKEGLWPFLRDIAAPAFVGVFEALLDQFKELAEFGRRLGSALYWVTEEVIKPFLKWLATHTKKGAEFLEEKVFGESSGVPVAERVRRGAKTFGKRLMTSPITLLNDWLDSWLDDKIGGKKFQHGGVVPETGPIFAHKGEVVIPAGFEKSLLRGAQDVYWHVKEMHSLMQAVYMEFYERSTDQQGMQSSILLRDIMKIT